jgi:hypothetical protein
MKARARGTDVYRQDRKSAAEGAHYADSCAADRGAVFDALPSAHCLIYMASNRP